MAAIMTKADARAYAIAAELVGCCPHNQELALNAAHIAVVLASHRDLQDTAMCMSYVALANSLSIRLWALGPEKVANTQAENICALALANSDVLLGMIDAEGGHA